MSARAGKGRIPRGASEGTCEKQAGRDSSSPATDASSSCSSGSAAQAGRSPHEGGERAPPRVSRGQVLVAIMKNPENARVLKKFALFAVLVAALPISTVLFLPGFVVGILQILQPESSKDWLEDTAKLCGAIVSVVLVNVVMLLYAALAYQEEKADWETVTRAQASRPGPEQKSSAASGTKKSN